jgi:hypothetical protein
MPVRAVAMDDIITVIALAHYLHFVGTWQNWNSVAVEGGVAVSGDVNSYGAVADYHRDSWSVNVGAGMYDVKDGDSDLYGSLGGAFYTPDVMGFKTAIAADLVIPLIEDGDARSIEGRAIVGRPIDLIRDCTTTVFASAGIANYSAEGEVMGMDWDNSGTELTFGAGAGIGFMDRIMCGVALRVAGDTAVEFTGRINF